MRSLRLPIWIGVALLSCSLAACSSRTDEPGGRAGSGGGHGGGGTGGSDPWGETTIYDLQDPATQPALESEVVVTDVVVTAVIERRTEDGSYVPQHFFVQERDGGRYSGIYVYNGKDGAPAVSAPAIGDVVEVAGTLKEYFGRTQIEALSLQVLGKDDVPTPAQVSPMDIATGSAEAAAWEGVLVEVKDVAVTEFQVFDEQGEDRRGFRIHTVGETSGGVIVGTMFPTQYVRAPLDTFSSVIGIVDFSYEEFRLEPRSNEDITFANDGSHPGLRDAGVRTVYQLQDQNDLAWYDFRAPATVQVENVIVTARAGNRLWVQEPAGGPFSGIHVRLAQGVEAPKVGQLVDVRGTYTEYFTQAQIDGATVTVHDQAVPFPDARSVTVADIRTGAATAEQWEGVLVKVEQVKNVEFAVAGTDGEWRGDFRVAPIDGGTEADGVIVGRIFFDDYRSLPPCGNGFEPPACDDQPDEFLSLTGVLDYSYSEFRLETRGNDDIVFLDGSNPKPAAGEYADHTLFELQDRSHANHPALGTKVAATNVVVTGVRSNGSFYVSEPEGGAYSGTYVFKHASVTLPAVSVGDVVTVRGTTAEYTAREEGSRPLRQIAVVDIDVVSPGAGTVRVPVVQPAEIAARGTAGDKWQSCLVTVEDLTSVTDLPTRTYFKMRRDPAVETDEIYVGKVFMPVAISQGDHFDAITGIVDDYQGTYRLHPRQESDLVPAE